MWTDSAPSLDVVNEPTPRLEGQSRKKCNHKGAFLGDKRKGSCREGHIMQNVHLTKYANQFVAVTPDGNSERM